MNHRAGLKQVICLRARSRRVEYNNLEKESGLKQENFKGINSLLMAVVCYKKKEKKEAFFARHQKKNHSSFYARGSRLRLTLLARAVGQILPPNSREGACGLI